MKWGLVVIMAVLLTACDREDKNPATQTFNPFRPGGDVVVQGNR